MPASIACVYRELNGARVLMPLSDLAVLRPADRVVVGEFEFKEVAEEFNRSRTHRVATPLGKTTEHALCEPEMFGQRKYYIPLRHPVAIVRKLRVYLRQPDGRGRAKLFVIDW